MEERTGVEHRVNNIEERTRKVEEAIIRFEYIADTLLVQFETRIKSLEKSNEGVKSVIYSTCDTKFLEIDTKIANTYTTMRVEMDKYFKWSIAISTTMFFLFVGALAFEQGEHTRLEQVDKSVESSVIENKTNVINIYSTLDKIDSKLEKIADTQDKIIYQNK